MASTCGSRRAVFRRIAQRSFEEWPAYDAAPLYNRSSLGGLEEDVRVVSRAWFVQEEHSSVDQSTWAFVRRAKADADQ